MLLQFAKAIEAGTSAGTATVNMVAMIRSELFIFWIIFIFIEPFFCLPILQFILQPRARSKPYYSLTLLIGYALTDFRGGCVLAGRTVWGDGLARLGEDEMDQELGEGGDYQADQSIH